MKVTEGRHPAERRRLVPPPLISSVALGARLAPIFLTVLLVLLIAGCSGSDESGTTSSSTAAAPPATGGEETGLKADTVVITVDSERVTWMEFKYWLRQMMNYYKAVYGLEDIADWSREEDGMPLQEFFLLEAGSQAVKARAIEAQSAARGLELTESDLEEIAQARAENVANYGSEVEYAVIVAQTYGSEEMLRFLTRLDYLSLDLFEELYGPNGERCSDEDVQAHASATGLMRARYVYLSQTDEMGKALSDEQKAANRVLLEDLIARLESSNDPVGLFSSLAEEHNQDPTLESFPDGLLFGPGAVDSAVETACAALDENQFSGIVETGSGLYLIMRLPIDPEMIADPSGKTLRFRTAYDYLFQTQVRAWAEEFEVRYEDAYSQIDVQAVAQE